MRFKTKLALLAAVAVFCVGLWSSQSFAASGLIYISPSSSSVRKGNDVTVSLRINPGTAVNAVQATVNYNSSDLQYVSHSLGVFSTCTVDTGVSFACAKLAGSTSSDSLIASITFKALVGSGSVSLSVSGANAVSVSSGHYTNPSSSGATVSFTSPPSSQPKTPTHTSSSGGTGSSGSTSGDSTSGTNAPTSTGGGATTIKSSQSSNKSKTALKPVTVATESPKAQFSTAAVTVSTSMPVQVYIRYGTSKDNLNQKSPLSKPGKQVTVSLDQSQLTPGTTYYYQAVAKDSDGKIVAKSSVKSFTTKGYTFSITVLDSHYRPLTGKVVTLHSVPMTAKTNNQGVATFTNVAPGAHHVEYTADGHTYTKLVYVANNFVNKNGTQSAAKQNAAVVLAGYAQPTVSSSMGRTVLVLVAIAVIGMVIISREIVVSRAAERHIAQSINHTKTPKAA